MSSTMDLPAPGPSAEKPMPNEPESPMAALLLLAEHAQYDVTSDLYNEACSLANRNELDEARRTLQVLLGLVPTDGEGWLLLGKVEVAAHQWRAASAAFGRAAGVGVEVPTHLLDSVRDHLAVEATPATSVSNPNARDVEMDQLRQQIKRVRATNQDLLAEVQALKAELRRFAWMTGGMTVLMLVAALGNAVLGDPAPGAVSANLAAGTASAVEGAGAASDAGAASATGVSAPVPPAGAASALTPDPAVGEALAAAGLGDQVQGVMVGGEVRLSGVVADATAKVQAEKVVQALPGVTGVDSKKLVLVSARDGGKHIVEAGDNPGKIAMRYYGDAKLGQKILDANPGVTATSLRVGQEIKIPKLR
jgi:nucleoid-associated protein YgaU